MILEGFSNHNNFMVLIFPAHAKKKKGNEEFSENQDKATFQVFLMQVYHQNSLHYYLLETQIQPAAQKNTGSLNFNLLVFL